MEAVAGPVILALVRGELRMLWRWSDAPDPSEEEERQVDETIERPSEVAAKAREAVKEDEVANQVVEHVEEDDSWMEGPMDTGGSSARRRKGGKKK